jgi:hypothetical protein
VAIRVTDRRDVEAIHRRVGITFERRT